MAVGGGTGFSVSASVEGAHAASSTSPVGLAAMAGLAFIYFSVLRIEGETPVEAYSTKSQRAVAWLVDFFAVMTAYSAGASFLMVIAESLRTHTFAWSYSRAYALPLDLWLGVPLAFLGFFIGLLYMGNAWKRGKQTIGEYLTGMKITFQGNPIPTWSTVWWRAAATYLASMLWPVTVFSKNEGGRIWIDRWVKTRVQICEPTDGISR
jgi:hypothetical protein